MPKKKEQIPEYGTTIRHGDLYYRTRITDVDGKRVALYAKTPEELYKKEQEAQAAIEEAMFRQANPTFAEYCEKWLRMQSAKVQPQTLRGYSNLLRKHIIKSLGEMYLADVTADDLRLVLVPLSKMSDSTYATANMLIKCIFYSAERNRLIDYNPSAKLSAKGGIKGKEKDALTDEQVKVLLDTVRGLPPYTFVMLGLYAGLRREEILALQWDCVFLDAATPYISVRRAWRSVKNRPDISTILKTPAARRDIPIPRCLVNCLREVKDKTISDFVIADSKGEPLAASQFQRVWNYIDVRTAKVRYYYKYVNGQSIKMKVEPKLGERAKNNSNWVYTIDFDVTPHMLRHTYITNLIYAGVDPKTVQYLAGHENSQVTMDIYAKVKYNRPEELASVVNEALGRPGQRRTRENSNMA